MSQKVRTNSSAFTNVDRKFTVSIKPVFFFLFNSFMSTEWHQSVELFVMMEETWLKRQQKNMED